MYSCQAITDTAVMQSHLHEIPIPDFQASHPHTPEYNVQTSGYQKVMSYATQKTWSTKFPGSAGFPQLWSPYVIGQTIIFSSCFFLLSSFFSSPNLSGWRLDVYHTLAHGVALVQIQNAGLKCTARGSLQIQDAKKSPSRQHRTTLSRHIFATKACVDNRKKKLVKQQYLLYMS